MRVIVASTNPVKIESARLGFAAIFPHAPLEVTGLNAPSGVSDQPSTEAETLAGALNRARHVQGMAEGDYHVGIEGGIEDIDGHMHVFAWIVVLSGARQGRSRTATFILPDEVAALVRQGLELGDADDRVFGRSNSKQANGSVGLLTRDRITRTDYYAPAVMLALIPFINPDLHFSL
ncbi:MAG: inosine/xanthosine triphosphatase [Anaerolineae bacterium]